MSHFRLLAVGFKDEDALHEAMKPYDESLECTPYIAKTKDEILQLGRDIYGKRCKALALYRKDPKAAKEKYGNFAKDVAEHQNDMTVLYNQSDPMEFYKMFIKDSLVDNDGNLLTTYNPDSKYDYYDIENETTIGELKEEKKRHADNVDTKLLSRIWNIIVNGHKVDPSDVLVLMNQPDKKTMLKMYGSMKNYIRSMQNGFAPAYCALLPDGWHEPGTVGWFGATSASPETEKEFRENFFSKFIEPYPDDTKAYIIDCHI